MSQQKSKIQWTERTWNPLVGCSKIASGCQNCYAEKMAARLAAMNYSQYEGVIQRAHGRDAWNGKVEQVESSLDKPLHWRKPCTVFVNSMSDLFHEAVPFEWIDRIFAVMALCPQHQFQILTKRPERAEEYLISRNGIAPAPICDAINLHFTGVGDHHGALAMPLPNVWLGYSASTQADLDKGLPHLLRTPAAVRFLSLEPLVDPIAFRGRDFIEKGDNWDPALSGISWVITGGESGPHARPCNVAWIRSIVSQCKAANVPVFVKQLGASPVAQFGHDYAKQIVNGGGYVVSGRNWPQGDELQKEVMGTRPLIRSDGRVLLNDPKGGDMSEWPEDIRLRQMPEIGGGR